LHQRLSLMREQALHLGQAERVEVHRTPAFKLLVGVDHEVVVRQGTRAVGVRAALVPPMTTHAVEAPGIAVGCFWSVGTWGASPGGRREPVILEGAALARVLAWGREVSRTGGGEDPELAAEGARLLAPPDARPLDGRVLRALRQVDAFPWGSSAALAETTKLSAERLRHLVAAETGVPLRQHRLFARTMRAIELMLRGRALSYAAAEAGFADQAHMTRTFRRCFGRLPSNRPAGAILHAPWAAHVAG